MTTTTKKEYEARAGYELSSKQVAFCRKAEAEGFDVYFTYSGRYMYGRQCPAVNHPSGHFGYKGAAQDGMGLGVVTYMMY